MTRQKDAAVYEAVEERRIPRQGRLERDQIIRLTGVGAAEKCPHGLRRVEVYDPEKDETLVFLTNHLTFGATTIAAIYMHREPDLGVGPISSNSPDNRVIHQPDPG